MAPGPGLLAATPHFGFMFFINIVAGPAEPAQPSGPRGGLIRACVMAGALRAPCRTPAAAAGAGRLIVAAAAATGLPLHLHPKAVRSAGEQAIARRKE